MRRRVIKRPGGEVVSRTILSARTIGAISGVSGMLSEARESLDDILARCERAIPAAKELELPPKVAAVLTEIKNTVEKWRDKIPDMRAAAESADLLSRE